MEYSALHFATHDAKTDILTFLIQCGSDINARNHFGLTPLLAAAVKGHANVVQLLIDHGSDIDDDIYYYHGIYEDSFLHLAAECKETKFILFLLKHGLDN